MWTWFYRLASPPNVYRVTREPDAVVPDAGGARHRLRHDRGTGVRASRLSAGRRFPDHLRARAQRLAVLLSYTTMAVAGAIGSSGASRWPCRGGRRGAHRRLVHPAGPGHGLALGPAHVGHLLGLGSAAHLGAHPAVPVLRGDVAATGFRGSGRGDRAAALLAIVGVVNVPIIHYSVLWWNSLHQGATVAKLGKPAMDGSMLWPLCCPMFLGFMLFFGAVLCMRLRGEVLNRERQATWVREALKS
jgi:hypothetical protein